MTNLIPLMQREWLQHRTAWMLLMCIPLVLAAALLSVGQLEFDNHRQDLAGADLATMLASMCILITTAVIFFLTWITSLFITAGLARRDHADRSAEFWLSLPSGHTESYAAPLLVHLLLVPAAALLVGLAGGYTLSLLVVARFVGLGEWFGLPWASLLAATMAVVGRILVGLPMATLWLSPLILLAVLSNALFRRWGLPVLVVGMALGSTVLSQVFGQPILSRTLAVLGSNAARALGGASGKGLRLDQHTDGLALQALPEWAAQDLAAAAHALLSPHFLFALGTAALLFVALVQWRKRGAGLAG